MICTFPVVNSIIKAIQPLATTKESKIKLYKVFFDSGIVVDPDLNIVSIIKAPHLELLIKNMNKPVYKIAIKRALREFE